MFTDIPVKCKVLNSPLNASYASSLFVSFCLLWKENTLENILLCFGHLIPFLLSQVSYTDHGDGQAFLEGKSVVHQWDKLPNCSTLDQRSSISNASVMNRFLKDFKLWTEHCAMFSVHKREDYNFWVIFVSHAGKVTLPCQQASF